MNTNLETSVKKDIIIGYLEQGIIEELRKIAELETEAYSELMELNNDNSAERLHDRIRRLIHRYGY